MSHYTPEELVARWRAEELTPEQMIGQLAQALRRQEELLRSLEERVRALEAAPRAASPTQAPRGRMRR